MGIDFSIVNSLKEFILISLFSPLKWSALLIWLYIFIYFLITRNIQYIFLNVINKCVNLCVGMYFVVVVADVENT